MTGSPDLPPGPLPGTPFAPRPGPDPDRGRPPVAPRLGLALVLLALAGFVDAVGFLGFGLFPSFMSGDSTQLGAQVVGRSWAHAAVLGAVVVIFVAGAFLGRLVRLRTGRRSPVLWAEAALLALAAAAARLGVEAGALACAVAAMGLQTGVLTHAGAVSVGTTYVTGTLARLGAGLADAVAGTDRMAWGPYLALWAALAGGAVLGAACYARVGLRALAAAALFAALVAAILWLAELRNPERKPA